ncbi:MAG: phospho-sugar mutase [Bacteroidales bacterium]|nr:phospho-sugar mutase [Bacteroidales bacterium]MDY4175093.1 phospho-sugar mutase [Bacteroidales bacterium]
MENTELLKAVEAKAQAWLDGQYDEKTKSEVRALMESADKSALIDAFYKDLEFGTGGLRGKMGVGCNRMNIYTVGSATQGLSNYLNREFASLKQISVVVGHDCRNNSRLFAETVANIFSANGIKVYLFDDLRPTPEMSFAIRKLGCQSGVIITASHNPKIYNGYKAYWSDGAQIIAPHDKNIIDEVNKITEVGQIKFQGNPDLIEIIGEDLDADYIDNIKACVLDQELIKRQHDIKIVYTPIHGTGRHIVPRTLAAIGFTNVAHVPAQDVITGDFPTVASPNPEEPAAMAMAIKKGEQIDADIVMASDPDADRIGVVVKNDEGKYVILNGNQTCLILTWFLLNQWKESGKIDGKQFVIKTIVTTEVIREMANKYGVGFYDVYTGFKWIAAKIYEQEGKTKYIGGGEESFGYLPYDVVRDKDAPASIALMAQIAAWAKDKGIKLYDVLKQIYVDFGFSKEKMIYIVREGKEGADQIQALMKGYRENPPATMGGSKVVIVKDYQNLTQKDLRTGEVTKLDMPATSNVLQYFTEDGSKVSVRPSGTEPKIKFYFEVKGVMTDKSQWAKANEEADKRIEQAAKDMGAM